MGFFNCEMCMRSFPQKLAEGRRKGGWGKSQRMLRVCDRTEYMGSDPCPTLQTEPH